MSYVMRVVAVAMTGAQPVAPTWVRSFDVDAHGGRGEVRLTGDRARALRFPDFDAALTAWKLRSAVKPNREDGKPNRPLTAYTVEIERDEVSEVQA